MSIRLTARGGLAAALCAAFLAVGNAPRAQPPAATGGAPTGLSAELIRPGLYRIAGGGGGMLLRVGSTGAIAVDSLRPGLYAPLAAEIQRLTPGVPVGALVPTATGPGQIGNAARFMAAGVPVIVQQRAKERVDKERPTAASAPVVTYGTDYMLRVGNVEAEIEHVGSGRTGADSVVAFRDLRVLAVGELFTAGTPQPDCASGGSFAGWAAAIAHLLWLDFDLAVPSHGPPVGKPELRAFQGTLEALAQRQAASPSRGSDCRPVR
jgi:glyoxylase-like metal-dependent hydrolase (beta-lactamase superfamily II)